jgi:hypothetical protein
MNMKIQMKKAAVKRADFSPGSICGPVGCGGTRACCGARRMLPLAGGGGASIRQ